MLNSTSKNALLLVDDDEVMIFLLKKIFEKKYNVFTANDGAEAMHHLSQGVVPDLIISDILMENINGYELIKHLTTSVMHKDIPVIILSVTSKAEISQHLSPNLSYIIINKPFDPIHLKKIVDSIIFKTYDLYVM